jgi:DNA/RNA endonuclease G (NUC1)
LVAAADQKGSQDDMDATFALSNISPQIGPGFNRDFWAKFEQFVRDAACESSSKAAYVATGPLFLPTRRDRGTIEEGAVEKLNVENLPKSTEWEMRYPVLGEPPAMMAVPTHFFKVVLVEGKDNTVSCAAFVLPNAPIPNNFPLRRFVVPLTDLEIVSGLEFFKRGLAGEDRQTYEQAERSFLSKTAKQLPGAGKIPSLPASKRSSAQELDGKANPKRWVAIRHLCETTACELKASRWQQVEGK